jgi:hypothetical protein
VLQAAEAARILAEEVEQVLAHLDATGGAAVNRSKVGVAVVAAFRAQGFGVVAFLG